VAQAQILKELAMTDSTTRFSSRVANYVKYRPSYPPEVTQLLADECGLGPASVVADIGSGTGILSALLLEHGAEVYAVEPNAEMRAAGEQLLRAQPRFHSIAAAAEATALPAASVDIIAAGQAFHWFDRSRARAEFERILRPAGWVALSWNERKTRASPFLAAYEALLLRYGTDYAAVNHTQIDAGVIGPFFGRDGFRLGTFPNAQRFDLAGLRGRVLSSSYVPEDGHPNHAPLLTGLEALFDEHQRDGTVAFEYDTLVYYGHLSPADGA
jgi:SAM-dependent methyltransferase